MQQATFGSTKLTPTGSEAIVVRLNAEGKILGAVMSETTGTYGTGQGWAVACDTVGNIYISGSFNGKMTHGATTISQEGKYGTFIWKIPAGSV